VINPPDSIISGALVRVAAPPPAQTPTSRARPHEGLNLVGECPPHRDCARVPSRRVTGLRIVRRGPVYKGGGGTTTTGPLERPGARSLVDLFQDPAARCPGGQGRQRQSESQARFRAFAGARAATRHRTRGSLSHTQSRRLRSARAHLRVLARFRTGQEPTLNNFDLQAIYRTSRPLGRGTQKP